VKPIVWSVELNGFCSFARKRAKDRLNDLNRIVLVAWRISLRIGDAPKASVAIGTVAISNSVFNLLEQRGHLLKSDFSEIYAVVDVVIKKDRNRSISVLFNP
jgi:hypothetical protein